MKYITLIDKLNRVVAGIIGGLLFLMVIFTMWQVLVRFLLTALGWNISAPWTEELSRYAMIWIVFLGAALACRKAQLISLDVVLRNVPRHVGVPMRVAVLLGSLVFFGLLYVLGMQFVEFGQIETSPVLSVSKSYLYLALPVGALLMALNTIALIAESHAEASDIRFAGTAEFLE